MNPHVLWVPSQNGRFFESPQRQKIMLSLDPLPSHVTYVLLQVFEDASLDPQGLVVSPHAVDVLTRLGLIRKTSSPNVAKKLLEKVVAKEDYHRFQYFVHLEPA